MYECLYVYNAFILMFMYTYIRVDLGRFNIRLSFLISYYILHNRQFYRFDELTVMYKEELYIIFALFFRSLNLFKPHRISGKSSITSHL
jgi:hypothetical protein